MIISLTGFMGSGKSSVGKVLSTLLSLPFADLDRLIVEKTGMSVPEIFAEKGEEGFRSEELETLKETLKEAGEAGMVLALGGGTFTIPEAREMLLAGTECVYLETGLDTILSRVGSHNRHRPLLKGGSAGIEALLDSRTPVYEMAHIRVSTDGKTTEDIANEIIGKLI